VLDNPPPPAGHELYNIGDNDPVGLMEMITTLEAALGREATKILRPMQPGDVTATFADISKLNSLTGYKPKVGLAQGLEHFAAWWRDFHPA
jgi:UDP-glucuronate 4-epimerase